MQGVQESTLTTGIRPWDQLRQIPASQKIIFRASVARCELGSHHCACVFQLCLDGKLWQDHNPGCSNYDFYLFIVKTNKEVNNPGNDRALIIEEKKKKEREEGTITCKQKTGATLRAEQHICCVVLAAAFCTQGAVKCELHSWWGRRTGTVGAVVKYKKMKMRRKFLLAHLVCSATLQGRAAGDSGCVLIGDIK